MSVKRPDNTARILWLIMAVGVIGVIGALIYLNGRPAAKGDLGCLNGVPGSRIAILVDKSDPFTPAQQDELKQYFERIQREFQVNDLVSIFQLNELDAMNKKPAFAHCVPQMEGSAVYENNRRIVLRFEEEFGNEFVDIVEGSIQSSEVEESPLLEMIRRISRSSYFKEEEGKARKLYVVSDMMQHVDAYSFYKQPVGFDAFRQSEYGKKILDDAALNGVAVDLMIIPRHEVTHERMQQVKRFWIDYLRSQGVRELKVSSLP